MIRYFIYCSAISAAFVYSISGGDMAGDFGRRVAACIACVLWLICMAARLVIGRARCARSRSAG